MTREALHIALLRLSAIIAVFVIAGSLTSVRGMNHDASMNAESDRVHVDGAQHAGAECTGDGCGLCDSPGGGGHFAEHCPDCLAQLPAAPETIRVERRHVAATPAGADAGTPDAEIVRQHHHSPPTADSGPSTRSPILRL